MSFQGREQPVRNLIMGQQKRKLLNQNQNQNQNQTTAPRVTGEKEDDSEDPVET